MTQRRNGPEWAPDWAPAWIVIGAVLAALGMILAAPATAQSADPLPYRAQDAYPNEAPTGESGPSMSVPLGKMSERPPCRCQNYGTYMFVGDVACIRTNKGPRMARCILKGNNTMWEFLTETCPVS